VPRAKARNPIPTKGGKLIRTTFAKKGEKNFVRAKGRKRISLNKEDLVKEKRGTEAGIRRSFNKGGEKGWEEYPGRREREEEAIV